MAAILLYGRYPFKTSSPAPVDRFGQACFVVLGTRLTVCSNDNPGLILTYFKTRSNFAT